MLRILPRFRILCNPVKRLMHGHAQLHELLVRLYQTYPIADLVGHADIAPGRKTDPGPCFDWHRLAGFRHSVQGNPQAS